MRRYIFLPVILAITGCSVGSGSGDSSSVTANCVNIFTLAPVNDALVTDANNQVAKFDKDTGYCFDNSIAYPITAKATNKTYIDVDYDGIKSASDLQPSSVFMKNELKSFCQNINYLTTLYYYNPYYIDNNITANGFKDIVRKAFNIDICLDAKNNQDNATVLFGTYNYVVDNAKMFNSIQDIEESVNKVNNFFYTYLTSIKDSNKIKYYSAYNSLLTLDEKKAQRADTTHKPDTALVLGKNLDTNTPRYDSENSDLDVFDIIASSDNSVAFLAAGHDEFAALPINNFSNSYFVSSVELESFGTNLYKQKYNNKECVFLANSKNGLTIFDVTNPYDIYKIDNIFEYYDDTLGIKNFSDISVVNSNGYVSVNENKRLLGISTKDKGYYLLNIKDNFNGCNPNKTVITVSENNTDVNKTVNNINETRDFLINEDSGYAVDAAFRDDGTYLYVTHKDGGITGYSTDILDPNIISSSKLDITLQNSAEAYNLKLFNNDNELIVTTDQGIQIYDVQGDNSLSFIGSYKSEGSQKDYFQKVDMYEDYIFLTDGYKGLKVLKLNSSFEPMLCGVEYFAPKDRPYELAKVESVDHYVENGKVNLLVGVSSYGIVKFKLDDILFKHCK